MGQGMSHGVEGVEVTHICSLFLEIHCAINVMLGKHICFSCCVELKGETGCREYRLQIKGSDNAAFLEGQRNAESRLNTLQYVNATPHMLELCLSAAAGKPVPSSPLGWNIICCSKAIAQPRLF